MTIIDNINNWSSPSGIAASLGIPTYAPAHNYNYICLSLWTNFAGPVNAGMLWSNPVNYFGSASALGSTNNAIRSNIRALYASKNIKLLVRAFGNSELPATFGYNANATATNLANFVIAMGFDGVLIDFQDSYSFQTGTG